MINDGGFMVTVIFLADEIAQHFHERTAPKKKVMVFIRKLRRMTKHIYEGVEIICIMHLP